MEPNTLLLIWYSLGWTLAAYAANEDGELTVQSLVLAFVLAPIVIPFMVLVAVFSCEHSPVIYRRKRGD